MPTFNLVCQNRNTLLKQAFSWQQLETCFLFPVLHQVSARISLSQHNIKYRDWMCRWYVQQGRTTRLYTMPCRICLPIKDRRLSSAVLRRVLHTWEFSGMANNKSRFNQTTSRLYWPVRSTTGVYHHHQTIITIRTTVNLSLLILGIYIFIRNGF